MCVDNDYEFRHFTAKREKICKRFIFKNEEDHERVFLVNISQFERYGQLCLCEVLMHLNKKGLNIKDYAFYMPQFEITVQAGDKCKIPFEIMTSKQIVFEMKLIEKNRNQNYSNLYFNIQNYVNKANFLIGESEEPICQNCVISNGKGRLNGNDKMEEEVSHNNDSSTKNQIAKQKVSESNHQKQQNQNSHESYKNQVTQYQNKSYGIKIKCRGNGTTEIKKSKQQQKTIQEALYKTKMWRMLHENCNFSLKNAAKVVELSKKTLDDYFLVLRVAEFHGYDFKSNLNKKIGHLRAFIRKQLVKITGRLSKQVKSFDLVPDPDFSKVMPIRDWSRVKEIEEEDASLSSSVQQSNSQNNPGQE